MRLTNGKRMVIGRFIAIAALAAIALTGCSDDDDSTNAANNGANNGVNNGVNNGANNGGGSSIVDVAEGAGSFSILLAALEKADLRATLAGEGSFTVFAPTDDAFAAFLEANDLTAEELLESPDLATILTYHVIAAEVRAADVASLTEADTVAGARVFVNVTEGGNVFINNAQVTSVDIEASNGVIHVIDSVLTPPSGTIVEIASGNPDFSALVGAVADAGLVEAVSTDGPFTVFAPTNAAFEALAAVPEGEALVDVLTYHVAAGALFSRPLLERAAVQTLQGSEAMLRIDDDGVRIAGALITMTDIHASNGVIHVLDAVIVPPATGPASIYDIAAGNEDFQTLTAALDAAGLAETFQGEGEFTVFAPTDAAFAALLEELDATPEELLGREDLGAILSYHVVGAAVPAEVAVTLNRADTLGELPIFIFAGDAGVFVNNAQVVTTDIEASNGVIHVIDRVLLPPTGDIVDVASGNDDFSSLVGAVSAAGLVETLQGEGPFTVFAPTNAAFEALEAVPEGDALIAVLTYHVLSGARFSRTLGDGMGVETVQGGEAMISLDGQVTIDGANIVMMDIVTTNGVIHVIDAVIVP